VVIVYQLVNLPMATATTATMAKIALLNDVVLDASFKPVAIYQHTHKLTRNQMVGA
jgi:hypothetical protein